MEISLTVLGQVMFIHVLASVVLTYVYGRRFSPSAGMSLLTIFAWLIPIAGPVCFAVYLFARSKPEFDSAGASLESKV